MGISEDPPDPPTGKGEETMAGQEQQQPQSRDTQVDEDIPEAPPAPPEAQASAATEGVDDLLDEIDGVLESNAEEFVRAFVQKGGQ
jgi:ubiquitin-like protein Pup